MTPMLVLGLSPAGRHAAAVLVADGEPLAAVEEDKLRRQAAIGEWPGQAARFCLGEVPRAGGDAVTVALAGRRARHLHLARVLVPHAARVWTFDHQTCHAASAFYPSPFDRSLVVTLDGAGDRCPGLVALGEGRRLRVLHRLRFPTSLGLLYTAVTSALGFAPHVGEHKTQWLSTEGSPDYLHAFRRLVQHDDGGWPVLDGTYLATDRGGAPTLSPAFLTALGLGSPGGAPSASHRAAVARSIQDFVEEIVVALVTNARARVPADHLCLAGGVFQNALLVRALEQRAGFAHVFVQPVANNAGTALGAAYLACQRRGSGTGRHLLQRLDLGPGFSEGDIKAVLDNCKIVYRYYPVPESLIGATVGLLNDQKIVAWYQGRMEFGQRALGHRSILASPFAPYVTQNLNHFIKHRDGVHPFALAVPAEDAPRYFDTSDNCRHLASVGTLRWERPELDAFAFSGSTVRVHLVHRDDSPLLWRLLKAFGDTAPAPILVNTSFNLFGEPLVSDPRAAVRSFYCAGLDAMALERFLIVK